MQFQILWLVGKNSLYKRPTFLNVEYSRIKEVIRKPITLIFSGQNMNVFAKK